MIAGSGVETGGISLAFAYVTDIAPTLLELTGTNDATPPGKHPVSGRSLVPVLRDLAVDIHPPQEAVGFETTGHRRRRRSDRRGPPRGRPLRH